MAYQIVPAILGENFNQVSKKISQVEGLTDWVHLDVNDGVFAEGFTWNVPADLYDLEGQAKIAVHLMIDRPEDTVGEWLEVADRVIVHIEATDRLADIVGVFGDRALMLGVALRLETQIETVAPFLDNLPAGRHGVKNIHLMSIGEIGHHGEPFDDAVLEKIKTLRAKAPNVTISVDGGITLDNAKSLIDAGADELIIGSALWQSSDVAKTIKEFQKL